MFSFDSTFAENNGNFIALGYGSVSDNYYANLEKNENFCSNIFNYTLSYQDLLTAFESYVEFNENADTSKLYYRVWFMDSEGNTYMEAVARYVEIE